MGKVSLGRPGSPHIHGQFIFMIFSVLPGGDPGFFLECPVKSAQAFKTAASRDIADAAVCVSQPALCRGRGESKSGQPVRQGAGRGGDGFRKPGHIRGGALRAG